VHGVWCVVSAHLCIWFLVFVVSLTKLFSFSILPCRSFKNVELVVSKCYYASGIIAITIIYQVNASFLFCLISSFS